MDHTPLELKIVQPTFKGATACQHSDSMMLENSKKKGHVIDTVGCHQLSWKRNFKHTDN